MTDAAELRELKIEVTYRCPLTCIHCSSDAYPASPVEMSQHVCLEVIRQAKQLGLQELALSGGEPMLWRGLDEAVALASDLGIDTTLYTSGNIENVQYRLDMLAGLGLKRVVFSVFGGTESAHEQVTRRRGSFQRTLEAARAARRVQLESGVHFVALRRNYRELEAVAALAEDVGAQTVSVLRFVPQGRGSLLQGDVLDRLQSLELKRTIERLKSRHCHIRTGSPMNVWWLNEDPECLSGTDRLIVGADLRIHPCDAFKQLAAEDMVGSGEYSDLSRYTLEQCWRRSPYLLAVRDSIAQDREEPCASCNALARCGSGCLAQKVLVDGGMHAGPDPACLMRSRQAVRSGGGASRAAND